MHQFRRALALLVITASMAAFQIVVGGPAHAGQVGVTTWIQGAGTVTVVEGSIEDGAPTSCTGENQDHRYWTKCPRIRDEEFLQAWVWLRATPASEPAGEWVFDSWRGCDELRMRDGYQECAVHSGLSSTWEKEPIAVFRDVVAPSVVGLSGSGVNGTQGRFHFTWSAPNSSRAECALDEAEFTPCTSDSSWTFAEGDHRLRVRATDHSGNVGPTATLDFTSVDTWIVDKPAPLTRSNYARFEYTTNAGDDFLCSLDGQQFLCGDRKWVSYGLTNLTDGEHVFEVTARRNGWVDTVPARYTWTVDTTAPWTSITGASIKGPQATFTFGAWERASYECKLNVRGEEGSWAPCGTSMTYDGLTDGMHEFQVRGTDAAGNVEQKPAHHAWTVDATAPDTELTGGPKDRAFVLAPTARFGVTTESDSTVTCTVDGVTQDCVDELVLDDLTAGTHIVKASASDAEGNTDQTPATRRWTVPFTASELGKARGWTLTRQGKAYGDRLLVSSRKGATLTRSVERARKVALVVSTGPGHGTVAVYAGKRRVGRFDLNGPRGTQAVRVVKLKRPFTGSLRVVVESSRREVRVEGLGVATS